MNKVTHAPPEQLPARDWLLTRPTEEPLPTPLDPAGPAGQMIRIKKARAVTFGPSSDAFGGGQHIHNHGSAPNSFRLKPHQAGRTGGARISLHF